MNQEQKAMENFPPNLSHNIITRIEEIINMSAVELQKWVDLYQSLQAEVTIVREQNKKVRTEVERKKTGFTVPTTYEEMVLFYENLLDSKDKTIQELQEKLASVKGE